MSVVPYSLYINWSDVHFHYCTMNVESSSSHSQAADVKPIIGRKLVY